MAALGAGFFWSKGPQSVGSGLPRRRDCEVQLSATNRAMSSRVKYRTSSNGVALVSA